MNVLFLAQSLEPSNGWAAYAQALTSALEREGVRLTVLTAETDAHGPRLPQPHDSRLAWMWAEFRLRAWLTAHPQDVIHVAVEPYARLWRAFGGCPFVVTVHGTYADPSAQGPAWAVRAVTDAYGAARKIIAVSSYTACRVPAAFRAKTVAIPNGVNTSLVDQPFDSAPAHGSPLVLSVGALKPRKGFDRLIAGFAAFRKTHPHAELVIVGREDRQGMNDALTRAAAEHGVANAVRLTGEVSRAALLGWYRACDAFALTPIRDGGFEGFGLVYLEANLFGKPAVGSQDSGAEDAVNEGESGCLVNAEDPADIARGLEQAMRIPADRIRASVARKTWQNAASTYRDAYVVAKNDV